MKKKKTKTKNAHREMLQKKLTNPQTKISFPSYSVITINALGRRALTLFVCVHSLRTEGGVQRVRWYRNYYHLARGR